MKEEPPHAIIAPPQRSLKAAIDLFMKNLEESCSMLIPQDKDGQAVLKGVVTSAFVSGVSWSTSVPPRHLIKEMDSFYEEVPVWSKSE